MIKNVSGQSIGAQMINASTGAAFASTVTVFITGDAGTQAIGSVGSGVCTSEGNGYYTYQPAQSETNYDLIAFTFTGSGAIPATIQVATITQAQQSALVSISTPGAIAVKTLLIAALQRLLAGGDEPAPEDVLTALDRLNDLIDAWKIEGLTVYAFARTLWTLTTAASYTVGTSGTIAVDHPANASLLHFALVDNSVTPAFERWMRNYTESEYRAIPNKAQTATYPYGFYYSPTAPLGTLTPYPIPTGGSLQGAIYAPAPAVEVGLSDVIALPPGYRRFYRDNLAVELAPDFDMLPSPALMQSAMDSKASVKRSNVRLVEMINSAAGLGHRDATDSLMNFYGGTL